MIVQDFKKHDFRAISSNVCDRSTQSPVIHLPASSSVGHGGSLAFPRECVLKQNASGLLFHCFQYLFGLNAWIMTTGTAWDGPQAGCKLAVQNPYPCSLVAHKQCCLATAQQWQHL